MNWWSQKGLSRLSETSRKSEWSNVCAPVHVRRPTDDHHCKRKSVYPYRSCCKLYIPTSSFFSTSGGVEIGGGRSPVLKAKSSQYNEGANRFIFQYLIQHAAVVGGHGNAFSIYDLTTSYAKCARQWLGERVSEWEKRPRQRFSTLLRLPFKVEKKRVKEGDAPRHQWWQSSATAATALYPERRIEEWRSNVLILCAAIVGELRCMQSQWKRESLSFLFCSVLLWSVLSSFSSWGLFITWKRQRQVTGPSWWIKCARLNSTHAHTQRRRPPPSSHSL